MMKRIAHHVSNALSGAKPTGGWARTAAHPGKSQQPHVHMHGEFNETLGLFGAEGDDPIGDANLSDPTEDLALPIDEGPWGGLPVDVEDTDFDSLVRSGRQGRESDNHLLEGGFGFEDEYYSGYGPAPLMGCERFG